MTGPLDVREAAEKAIEHVFNQRGQGFPLGLPSAGQSKQQAMEARARERLSYNGPRSGHAAPATELARYVLALGAALDALVAEVDRLERALRWYDDHKRGDGSYDAELWGDFGDETANRLRCAIRFLTEIASASRVTPTSDLQLIARAALAAAGTPTGGDEPWTCPACNTSYPARPLVDGTVGCPNCGNIPESDET